MTVATDVPTVQVQPARTDEQLEARRVLRLATTAKHERGTRFAHRLTDPTSAASSSSLAPGATVGRRPEAPPATKLAVGESIVIIAGALDISVGSIAGIAGVVAALAVMLAGETLGSGGTAVGARD